ncbi:MAG: hypothetical protein LLG06_03195 [Desulfobacteraceae bacterium]|nr:hypothetical protein [Desulfobacteraceae bacterium]
MKRALLTLDGYDIAPRFDLAPEVMIVGIARGEKSEDVKTVVLPRPSAEMLCRVIMAENIQTVVCGGIEEEYLEYLNWKRVETIHSIIGPAETVLERLKEGKLRSGEILVEKRKA